MAKTEAEQIVTHRFDPLYCIERMQEVKYRFKQRVFFMLVYWGIFLFVIGLLFYEKWIGNLTEDLFWAYLFIIAGLLVLLKAAVFMLMRGR
jgi:phosphoglycerol transferase MdoB-like AlkP superfamily enzyme